ncbi:MAG: hypothetical protein ACRCY5_07670 [Phocaeicola sp.]
MPLEANLGINADIWIRTQADYDLQTAREHKIFAERLEQIRKMVAVL